MDDGLGAHTPTREQRWKLVPGAGGDDPELDEFFHYFVSGVQPVREEAVVDFDSAALENRMRAYFDRTVPNEVLFGSFPAFVMERARYDPTRTRNRLLGDSTYVAERVVPFLFKPFDGRWLYWEPLHKLLNESRRELIPYYLRPTPAGWMRVEGQVAIIAAQTARRPGAARPAVSKGVAGFHAVDPDARVLPRLKPREGLTADSADHALSLGRPDDAEYATNIGADWLEAARTAGVTGSDLEVGDTVFYALIAVMNAPSWVASIGTDNDDFAGVPLPSDPRLLAEAGLLGERLAILYDPFADVDGITRGALTPALTTLAVPDAPRDRSLTAGNSRRGGVYEGDSILWNEAHGWRNVSQEIWDFNVGGFPVIPKWLSYRHVRRGGYTLTDQDLETVTHICRRIAGVLALSDDCERMYAEALASPLAPMMHDP